MIRKKSLVGEAHPKYGELDFWYTIRLKHGGMVLDDLGKFEYLGGSTSVFDFVDGKKWELSYLKGLWSGLCEGLGYLGRKKFFSTVKGQLLPIETNEDAALLKNASAKSREYTLYLKAEKNAVGVLNTLEGDDGVDGSADDDWLDKRVSDEIGDKRVVEPIVGKTSDVHNIHIDEHFVEDIANWLEYEFDESRVEDGNKSEEDGYNSEEEDDDFSIKEDDCDAFMDDIMYNETVTEGLEFLGKGYIVDVGDSSSDSSDENSDGSSSDSDFSSIASDSDGEANEIVGSSHGRNFSLGQKFSSKAIFKDDITSYAVRTGRPCNFVKNDNKRIYAKCKKRDDGCGWHIHALKVLNETTFQIRQMDLNHSCPRQFNVSNAKSTWLAKRYETTFRCEPNRKASGFRKAAMADLRVYISPQQAFRTRQKALKMIEGDTTDQYTKLWDYADILRKKNPGSTIILQLDDTPAGRAFKSFYICLAAVKKGFRSGCRPWIGVDGCHLSGPNAGVLLTAVGIDPNNCPYPIAYAVVTIENRETWEWFLALVKEDLLVEREDIYCFMSDKQKGLIAAFENILPTVENRFCVRHLHGNMKRAGFKGFEYKKLLWRAANATTVHRFKAVMEVIDKKDANLYGWLISKPATQWSKSHFNTFGKCDTLVNNMCEQFNNCIKDARDMPILTMLEWIRQYMMMRLQKNRDSAECKWEGRLLCANILKRLNKSVKAASDCTPIKSTAKRYEVLSLDGSSVAVNLDARTCDCRRWELSGIPCKHATSAIQAEGEEPENYVHNCYHVETYMAVYTHAIAPMGGQEVWEKTGLVPPLPPSILKRKKGRPEKERKFGATESPNKKQKKKQTQRIQSLGKQTFKVKCRYCGELGHNKKGCAKRKDVEGVVSKTKKSKPNNVDVGKSKLCSFCIEYGHNEEDCEVKKQLEKENRATDGGSNMQHAEEAQITQPDLPDMTEDDEHEEPDEQENEDQDAKKKPTTRKGRQELARNRVVVAAASSKKRKVVINKETMPSIAYSISTEVNEQIPETSQPTEPIDPNLMKFKSTHGE